MLGRMYDAIEYRGVGQEGVETLAKYAGVPVYNGLTDEYHPTQMLADVMTMREHSDKPISEIKYAYRRRHPLQHGPLADDRRLPDGHGRAHLRAEAAVAVGRVRRRSPRELEKKSGAKLTITDDPKAAVKGVDFIHTDVWVSMGEPKEVWKERIELLKPYQVNTDADEGQRQPAGQVHALPAGVPRHRDDARQADRRELRHARTASKSPTTCSSRESNIAFEQAENRMHTIKAILVATLGD